MEGHVSQEDVLLWLKKQDVHAVRIEKLPSAKHIFTHKEWHMKGFQVRVDELEPMKADGTLLFVRPEETEERYPIPSAFAVYSRYLNIKTGRGRIGTVNDQKEEKEREKR